MAKLTLADLLKPSKVRKLSGAGFETVEQIAAADFREVVRINGIGRKSLNALRELAGSQSPFSVSYGAVMEECRVAREARSNREPRYRLEEE